MSQEPQQAVKSLGRETRRVQIDEATPEELDWLTHKAAGFELVRFHEEFRRRGYENGRPPYRVDQLLAGVPDRWCWISRDNALNDLRQYHRDAGTLRLAWTLYIDLDWAWNISTNDFEPVATGHELKYDEQGEYVEGSDCRSTGPTPIIAALRCYLKHHFGVDAEVPVDLGAVKPVV